MRPMVRVDSGQWLVVSFADGRAEGKGGFCTEGWSGAFNGSHTLNCWYYLFLSHDNEPE
jgi:hypothetical protein